MAGALVAAGCSFLPTGYPQFCESNALLVDANFPGGNFDRCSVQDDALVSIVIRPEDAPPINESPWYAFRLSPKKAVDATIGLTFEEGYARYWPKTSTDGQNWRPIAAQRVNIAEDGKSMTVSVPLGENPVWIAAQELVLPPFYNDWLRALSAVPNVTVQTLGRSVLGHPIQAAMTPAREEAVFLFGRQHPPEVTGAMAMKAFVDTVFADTPLADRFRERYTIVVVPLINPDGVVAGHWRHNMNGVDLNRDWGPFTQPETQGIALQLASMEMNGIKPALMLDFHSTRESLFYTQLPGDFDMPVDFATAWLTSAKERLPDFEFKHDPRPPSGQENTKNYFFNRYHIPAITYEIGDELDRDAILGSTPVFAEEMMRLMLER